MQYLDSSDCVVFTALFDINRASNDGRRLDQYVSWLQKTASIFGPITVFHDGCLSEIEISNVIPVNLEPASLRVFAFEQHVRNVIHNGRFTAKGDITFQNPKYSLVQYSKFELAIRAMEKSDSRSALWVDAGISRFLSKSVSSQQIQESARFLLDDGYDLALEIDLKRNLSFPALRISQSPVGTCKRVVSGTSFWVSRNYANDLFKEVYKLLESWQELQKWDNEQVLLRNLEPWLTRKLFIIIQGRNATGSIARQFSHIMTFRFRLQSKFVCWLLKRSSSLQV